MPNRRLLEHDPLTGTSTYHWYDDLTDTTTIETVEDVTPIIEQNKRVQNEFDAKATGLKANWWKIASIPNYLINKWMVEEKLDVFSQDPTERKRLMRKLRDPEFKFLRTGGGKI